MNTDKNPRFALAFGTLFGIASVACAATLPKEGNYDYVNCYAGIEHASISMDDKHRASIREFSGTIRATVPGSFLDGASFNCISFNHTMGAQPVVSNVCVTVDADGDKLYTRFLGDGKMAEALTVGGTGKYVGAERVGKTASLGTFPTAKAGQFQTCVQNTGTYKLK